MNSIDNSFYPIDNTFTFNGDFTECIDSSEDIFGFGSMEQVFITSEEVVISTFKPFLNDFIRKKHKRNWMKIIK